MDHNLLKRVSRIFLAIILISYTNLIGIQSTTYATINATSLNNDPDLQLEQNDGDIQSAVVPATINTTSANFVSVIVQMESEPILTVESGMQSNQRSVRKIRTEQVIQNEQTDVLNDAKFQGINIIKKSEYNTVFNGMEILIPANQLHQLAAMPGVSRIFENETFVLDTTPSSAELSTSVNFDRTPLEQIGVDYAWNQGLTGKGLKVGVLDTGIDPNHPDIKSAYKGGYDSVYNDNEPFEDEASPINGIGATNHGTHVAGTIIGRAENPDSNVVQKGVAYEADLYAYKVLADINKTGLATGTTAQILDGIERAVKDKMDVLNLSLGSSGNKNPNSALSIAVNNAVMGGIVVVISNGNSGSNYYSVGSPHSAELPISVGAVHSQTSKYTATATSSIGNNTISYKLPIIGMTVNQYDFETQFGTKPVDAVYVGLGQEADYANVDVAGKIAFISRGKSKFVEKFKIAKEKGAKAVVLFNGINNGESPDLSTNVFGRDGYIDNYFGASTHIPIFSMKGTEGRALALYIKNYPKTPFTFTFKNFNETILPGDLVSDFSSRGPVSDGKLSIKPNVIAPGVGVLSSVPIANDIIDYEEAYLRMDGTSMAAPHVSGLTLLLKQARPNWTPFDIRAALSNTSERTKNESGKYYDVYTQGAGRVNIEEALKTPALLQTVEDISILDADYNNITVTNYGDNTSFGVIQREQSYSKKLQLKNTTANPVQYTASVQLNADVTTIGGNTPNVNDVQVSLDNTSISVAGGAIEQFNLTVLATSDANEGLYEGIVVLESPGSPSLHLPFSIYVGNDLPNDGLGIQKTALSNHTLVYNGSTPVNNMDLIFNLTAQNVNYIALLIYDHDNNYLGYFKEIYNEDYSILKDEEYTINGITHAYYDENGSKAYLAEGEYELVVYALENYDANTDNGTKSYNERKVFNVKSLQTVERKKVSDAKANFSPLGVNTTIADEPVLTFPTTQGITYSVFSSSDESLIDNNGILKAWPAIDGTEITLTITITSDADSTITDVTEYKVTLNKNTNELELQKVQNAKAAIDSSALITNTTNIGQPVLTLPTTPGVAYVVSGSSDQQLISTTGELMAQPNTSETEVTVTLTIASELIATIKETIDIKVKLYPVVTELQKVQNAKAALTGNTHITNTTITGQPVLTLPNTPGIKYVVSGSSDQQLISSTGELVALPTTNITEVTLTVLIVSEMNPMIFETINLVVFLIPELIDPDELERQRVQLAKNNFVENVNNLSIIGDSVLTLPATDGILYSVSESTDINLISNNGMLVALPGINSTEVTLKVKISSLLNPAIWDEREIKVTLNPPTPDPQIIERQKVLDAKNSYVPLITNTTTIGIPVISLPQINGILMGIQSSSDTQYISSSGILTQLPNVGSVNVELTISFASQLYPLIVETQTVEVILIASSNDYSGNTGGIVNDETANYPEINTKPIENLPVPEQSQESSNENDASSEVFNRGNIDFAMLVAMLNEQIEQQVTNPSTHQWQDINGHWSRNVINTLNKLGVINGQSATHFNPNANITRAEFATLIVRTFNIQSESSMINSFNDTRNHWAKEDIEKLVAMGIIQGYVNGTFKPNAKISREEMVIIFARILNLDNLEKDNTKGKFNDIAISSPFARDYIVEAAKAGIISGRGDGIFDPKGNATRSEALMIIWNALNLDPQIKELLSKLMN